MSILLKIMTPEQIELVGENTSFNDAYKMVDEHLAKEYAKLKVELDRPLTVKK